MRRKRSSLTVGAYTESKSILGTSVGYHAALRMVPHLDLKNSIASLAKISWALETLTIDHVQLQLELAKIMLADYISVIEKLLENRSTIVFFQPQVLTLMKLLILKSANENQKLGELPEDQLRKMGLVLLGIADEISNQYKQTMKQFEDDDLAKQVAFELVLASFLIRNPRVGLSLSRATHLYINIAHEIKDSGDVDYIDIEEIFFQATGVQLKEYLSFGIGVIVRYLQFSNEQDFPEDSGFIYFQPEILFRNAKVAKEILAKILNYLSLDVEGYRNLLRTETKRELVYDFLVFKSHPLLMVEEDVYLPLSLQFLLDRVTIGVYWILFDYLKDCDKQMHEKFMRFHGKLFQNYVEDIIDESLKRKEAVSVKKYIDLPYLVKKERHRSSDVILFKEKKLLLFEISATRLQAKRTMGLGQEEALNKDIDKMVLHNARSLNKCIEHIKSRDLILDGVNPEEIESYYPIIVTFEGLPRHPAIEMFLKKRVAEENILMGSDIAPLAMLDAEDLEEIEGYSEGDFIQFYFEWLSSGKYSQFSLRDYLKRFYPAINMRSHWLDSISKQIFNEATQLFFGKPLSVSGDDFR